MPELAAAYAFGILANLVLLGIIVFKESRKQQTAENPLKAHIILGLFCAFFSWGGFIFFSLIELSMSYLARRKANNPQG